MQSFEIDDARRALQASYIERLGLSARAWNRILRVARTLADLEGRDGIHTAHLTEAIGYRRLDRHRDEGYRGAD